jgi:rubrerythrin
MARDEEGAIPAVELIAALAKLDLEAALAYEAAADFASEEDELVRTFREFAREHRAHLEALNETLESEGEPAVGTDPGSGSKSGGAIAALLRLTSPLGREIVVVTVLGAEQLTNLAYDAALSYDWDEETGAMLRRFQEHEERHVSWLASEHGRLGLSHEPPPAA